jgi:hypothetical protein
MNNLKDHVLAEDVEVRPEEHVGKPWCRIKFSWLCSVCGARHWAEERGRAKVRFPWSDETPTDEKSIYDKRGAPDRVKATFRVFAPVG